MSLFDRDASKHLDPSGAQPDDPSAASGSNSDADDAAAVIANLVRRTSQRHAAPGPSSVAQPNPTVPQPPMPAPPVAQPEAQPVTQRPSQPVAQPEAGPVTQRFPQPVAQPEAQPVTQRSSQPVPQPVTHRAAQQVRAPLAQRVAQLVPPGMHRPSRPVLIAGGAVAAVLIASAFALSRPATPSSDAGPASAATHSSAPAIYTVKVTDVITDCADHSHGRTKSSFKHENCVKATRSLATGQVSGRPTVFVISRIEMASPDAAASVKQVLDATGTGNLNDLLREGKTFAGAPGTMPASGYASVQTGPVVVVAEAGFVKGPSSSSNPALRSAAAQVAALVTTKG